MANRFFNPNVQYFDNSGNPLAGGFLYFYTTGTSTPVDTYSESTATTPNANPVVLDSAGRAGHIFLSSSVTYKVVCKDSAGNTIWTADPFVDPAANVTAAVQAIAGNPNGSLAGNAGSVGGSGASLAYDITNSLLYVCTTTGTSTTAVWTQVGATLTGQVAETGVATPTALSADQDNYAPSGNTSAAHLRIDLSANVVITGLDGEGSGVLKTIHNISSANTLTLGDGSIYTSSSAAHRFAFGGTSKVLNPGESIELWYDTASSRWRQKGVHPNLPIGVSGFRLCLATETPVHASDVTAAATIYYTPYLHNMAMLYNGTNFYVVQFSELSQALSDSTKSPAAAAVSSLYDMFLWNDAGTIRCTRGPAWSSATTRGTGSGTTEIERVAGVYMNAEDITNGPAANRGIYVGTIATNASTQCAMMVLPAAAAGGGACRLDVWNMFNRVNIVSVSRDSTNSWAYGTATTRATNASNSNRITLVAGMNEDPVSVSYNQPTSANGNASMVGIGLDSTSAIAAGSSTGHIFGDGDVTPGNTTSMSAFFHGFIGLGQHYIQALENAIEGNTTTNRGDNGAPTTMQMALGLTWRC
jgi:hypothetical protein